MQLLSDFYPFVPSPNVESRRGESVVATVVHYTATGWTEQGDISWLIDPAARASAHFVIGRLGDVTQLAPLDMATWHAGASQLDVGGEVKRGCNRFTIGVELDNCGLLHQGHSGRFYWEIGGQMQRYRGEVPVSTSLHLSNGHDVKGWWEPYPEKQLEAFRDLMSRLRQFGYEEATQRLVGHSDVAVPVGRKLDPGPLFPWARFRAGGDLSIFA